MDEREIQRMRFLIGKFREHMSMTGYADRSVADYPAHLKFFLAFLAADHVATLGEITPDVVYRYQMHLYRQKWKERPLSLATQSGRLVVLKAFFRYLFKRGEVLADPTARTQLPKCPRHLPRSVMTTKDVRKILQAPNADRPLGLRDKAILELLYSTGIRNSELRSLAVYDVDIQNQELRVRGGKGGKDRVVPTGEIAARCVDAYVKTARPRLLAQGEDPAARSLLFVSCGGKRITMSNLVDLVRKYARRAKLTKPVTPHAFRHTCATHMLHRRAGLRHVQELLGHRSLSTTQRYTHVDAGDLKREHKRTHPREQPL